MKTEGWEGIQHSKSQWFIVTSNASQWTMAAACSLWCAWFLRVWIKRVQGRLTFGCPSLSFLGDKYKRKKVHVGVTQWYLSSFLTNWHLREKLLEWSLLCLSWITLQKKRWCGWHRALHCGEIHSMLLSVKISRWSGSWITCFFNLYLILKLSNFSPN